MEAKCFIIKSFNLKSTKSCVNKIDKILKNHITAVILCFTYSGVGRISKNTERPKNNKKDRK